MQETEKRFDISENRILIYNVSNGFIKPSHMISEGFVEKGKVLKTYTLFQGNDYNFNGWFNSNKTIRKLSFDYDNTHPLYLPLLHLLNDDNELIIDDDDTLENNKKYIRIYKCEDKIYLDFVYSFNKKSEVDDRFRVFVKNIVLDGRSKIDKSNKDTKERLAIFFNEVNQELTKDNEMKLVLK